VNQIETMLSRARRSENSILCQKSKKDGTARKDGLRLYRCRWVQRVTRPSQAPRLRRLLLCSDSSLIVFFLLLDCANRLFQHGVQDTRFIATNMSFASRYMYRAALDHWCMGVTRHSRGHTVLVQTFHEGTCFDDVLKIVQMQFMKVTGNDGLASTATHIYPVFLIRSRQLCNGRAKPAVGVSLCGTDRTEVQKGSWVFGCRA
jgi:hypothetical protein